MIRPPTWLSLLLVLMILIVGCSSPPTAPATEPGSQPPEATPTVPAPANVAATATAVALRETLHLATTEPPTLDPTLATDQVSADIIVQLFEGLVGFDERGSPVGLGAESWEVSDDGMTYTFVLRAEPRWSDGQPVTAGDYEFAWRRAIDPKTAADYASLFFPLKNAVKINTEGLDPQLLGVTAKDDRTLIVTLEAPATHFLRLVSTWPFSPLRRDVVELHGDRWTDPAHIVTNGPFVLSEWTHDKQIVLDRHDGYAGERPRIRQAVYRIFPEGAGDQVFAAYEAGNLDALGPGTAFEIPPAQVDRVLADAKLRQEVRTYPQSGTMFLAFNHRRPHLQDARVRIALGQVIEREKLLRGVLRRVGDPALGLQPEGIVGREPLAWPTEDVEQARQRLAEAGFPDGEGFPQITFTFNDSPQWRALGEYLKQRYQDTLGIDLKLEPMEWSAYLRWRRGEEWAANGDIARAGWFSDYEDPYPWYNVLWDSREDPAAFNTGWKHDEYDRLVREARGEADGSVRADQYRQAEEILAGEYPALPLFHYALRTMVKPHVQGYAPERVLGLTRLKLVHLDDRARPD